jgi:hypothetical protein
MTYFSVGDGPMGQGVVNLCKCRRDPGFVTAGQRGPVGRATHGGVVLCATCGFEGADFLKLTRFLSQKLAFLRLTLDLATRWKQG